MISQPPQDTPRALFVQAMQQDVCFSLAMPSHTSPCRIQSWAGTTRFCRPMAFLSWRSFSCSCFTMWSVLAEGKGSKSTLTNNRACKHLWFFERLVQLLRAGNRKPFHQRTEAEKVGGWPIVAPLTPSSWESWWSAQLVGWIVSPACQESGHLRTQDSHK